VKSGDRVVVVGPSYMEGMTGTVVEVSDHPARLGVMVMMDAEPGKMTNPTRTYFAPIELEVMT